MYITLKEKETMQDLVSRLAESFELVYGIAPVAYWYENLDENGRIKDIHFSNRMRELLGYKSTEEFPDELSTLMTFTHPDDVQIMLQGAIDTGTGKSEKYDVQYRIRKADGDYLWCNATGELVKDSRGNTVGMYGAFIDVSEEVELREKQENERRTKELIRAFSEEYDAAFYGRISDDAFQILSNADTIFPSHLRITSFEKAVKSYVTRFVHPDDVHMFDGEYSDLSVAKKKLPVGESESFEYRDKTGGEYSWHRATLRRITEDEVLAGIKNCDSEIVEKKVTEKLMDEYDAIYIVDLNRNEIRPARSSRVSSVGAFEEKINYTQLIRRFAETVAPGYREDWIEFSKPAYMKQYMEDADHREYIYELPEAAEHPMRRFTIDVLERLNGEASIVLFSFVGIDDKRAAQIETENREKRAMAVMSSMAEDFDYISAVNIRTGEVIRYLATEKFYQVESKIDRNLSDRGRLVILLKSIIHPDEWERFKKLTDEKTVESELKKNPVYKFECLTVSPEGKEEWYRFKFADMPGEPDLRIIGLLNIDANVRREQDLAVAQQKAEHEKEAQRSYEHASFRADALQYIVDHECTVSEFLENFAARLLGIAGCDQIIYRDIEGTRFIVNSTDIGEDFEIPEEYCGKCEYSNVLSPVFRDGEAVYDDCREVGNEIAPYEKCPIKSKMTRLVHLDGKPFGYLSVHYLLNKHTFSEEEKRTARDLTSNISLVISRLAGRKRNAELEKETRSLRIIEGLASEYTSVYYVNLEDDSFIPYSMNEDTRSELGEVFSTGLPFSDALRLYTEKSVFAPDKEMILKAGSVDNIKKQLEGKKQFRTVFRSSYYGDPGYREMTFVKVGDEADEAKAAVLGFSDKNREILDHMIGNLLYDDFAALFYVDLENDYISAIKNPGIFDVFTADAKSHVFSSNYMKWADLVDDDAKDFFAGFNKPGNVRKYMADSDHKEYVYHSSAAGHWFRFECRVLERDSRNGASKVILSQQIIDSERAEKLELQKQVLEQASLTRILVSDYERALYVRTGETVEDDRSTVLISSEFLTSTIPGFSNDIPFGKQLDLYIDHIIHPDDREMVREETERGKVLKGIHENLFYSVDFRTFEKGEPHFAQLRFANVGDGETDYGFVIGLRRTDEEKQAEETLKEALAMAQSANRAKTTFLNNMSHDIRTPMNAIIGYTGLAASHIDNKAQVQEYLSKIGQSSDHLLSLINDVLDMSRIESGKMNLDEKEENLSDIIHTLRDIVQADIRAKQLNFFVDAVDVNDENIVCDKLRLNQVLLNVLSNSIKYTAPGGTVTMRVREKTVKPNGYASFEFTVKDNGMGMDKEFLTTIFDPFTRVKSSTVSGIQGTGLGMAITKNIIDMMGGKIEIDSELGKGTETVISFDFMLQNAPKEPEEIPELKGVRGLVVDDDLNTCLSISNMLEDIGMRSEWCTSGKEAVFRAEAACQRGDLFRVYILDWLMPDMNGIETARRIRKVIGDDAPIIVLTAYDWSDIEEEAKEAGVTAFVSKPLFPSDLHKVLSKCIGRIAENEDVGASDYDFTGRKVLLVEDNELNREIAMEILSEDGFVIETAEDGHIAVEKMKTAKAGDYDIILMDVQMPTMDGYEATKLIRELKNGVQNIPIIAMTANAFEEDRRAALEAGMNEHIAKPIDVRKLKETLSRFL